MPLLQIQKTSKLFGKVAALFNVSFEINEGEALGIVGPNGSGKTTLINSISGFYRPTSGEILFQGKKISGLRPDQICSLGITRTFQSNMLYGDATTIENMLRSGFLTVKTGSWGQFFNVAGHRSDEKTVWSRAHELLEQFGLADFKDARAGDLPHGSQRVLGVAMAVASRPKLLLLDEPMTGMNDEEVTTMLTHIDSLRDAGHHGGYGRAQYEGHAQGEQEIGCPGLRQCHCRRQDRCCGEYERSHRMLPRDGGSSATCLN